MSKTTDTPGTDVATTASTDVALADLEASLVADNQSNRDASDLVIPMLKVGQPLTDEVSSGDASAGEFINALTREGLGREIEFVVAGYQKGRFKPATKEDPKVRVAYGTSTVPWKDDPFFGRPFAEHPDAEEAYREAVNNGDREWESGPPIRTTYNFTGFVISGLDEDEEPIPVRLSLMRTNAPAARKWATILDAVLRGRYWDSVFVLTTDQEKGGKGNFYTVNVKQTRKTTPEERQRAVQLALVLREQNVTIAGEDGLDESAKPKVEPQSTGGLAV